MVGGTLARTGGPPLHVARGATYITGRYQHNPYACPYVKDLEDWDSEKKGAQLKVRCRANMAHITEPRTDSGLGFQVRALRTFQIVPSPLESGN
jgi:hypothetical protein